MTKAELLEFCKDDKMTVMTIRTVKNPLNTQILRKTHITANIYILETHDNYGPREESKILTRKSDSPFEYVGFFHAGTGKIYDLYYDLIRTLEAAGENLSYKDMKEIKKEMVFGLSGAITEIVSKSFSIEPCEMCVDKGFVRNCQEGAECVALSDFFNGKSSSARNAQTDKVWIDNDTQGEFTDNDVDSFLVCPEDWAKRFALSWLKKDENREKAERRYLAFVAETDALKKLEADTDGRHYLIRKIQEIARSNRKTVVISIDKDGKPFEAKAETAELYKTDGKYWEYAFEGKDRKAFLDLYGKYNNDFDVKDIVSISYSGKEIYHREEGSKATK